MTINGESPVPLQSELRYDGNTVVISMTNRDLASVDRGERIPRDKLLIQRILTLVNDQVFETIEIKNFDSQPHSLQIEFWCGGKFDDIFEVRGFARKGRGKMLPVTESRDKKSGWTRITIQYEGLDDLIRKTVIQRCFDVEKIRVSPEMAGHFTRVYIAPQGSFSLRTTVAFNAEPVVEIMGQPFASVPTVEMMDSLSKYRDKEPNLGLEFDSDNAIVNRSIKNGLTDIYMLLTREDNSTLYPYAGIPWFSAPFGRDGLITAYQMLPWAPNLAKGVLNYVFGCLGSKVDPFTDEQPGKVFHEMRRGEMAKTREVPFLPYYGSVDSTPLSLILLQEYVRWTHDVESLRKWWPDALRALAWIEQWGDSNGDGFLDYAKQSPNGLVNQGWKDSGDSIMHADGRLAEAPIALCEVQGYAFRAKTAMADLAVLLGEQELGTKLRFEALQLRHQFIEKYWDGEKQIIYLALDGHGKPCVVRSSNMGHCLWSEILTPHQASEIAKHLLSGAMFSGYGIRTLADTEVVYNPLSYHNGSIWPHDNSLIMEGLRKYGLVSQLETVSLALLDVLETSEDFRLPELFCGFRRRGNAPPIPYEVACKPQAWAAGSIFLMLKSMLGMSMDAHQSYVVFNSPILTSRINRLEIKGLRGKDWEMDLIFRRSRAGVSVDVTRKTGNVRVLTVK